MNPLTIFIVSAAATAFALHKRKWGYFFLGCAWLVWLLLMQIIIAYSMHGNIQ